MPANLALKDLRSWNLSVQEYLEIAETFYTRARLRYDTGHKFLAGSSFQLADIAETRAALLLGFQTANFGISNE